MKTWQMKGEAKGVALRVVGRRVARRLGVEDETAMEDTAQRLYNQGACRGLDEWDDVVRVLEQRLEEAHAKGEVRRVQRTPKTNQHLVGQEGWHEARYQDDGGFWRRP